MPAFHAGSSAFPVVLPKGQHGSWYHAILDTSEEKTMSKDLELAGTP